MVWWESLAESKANELVLHWTFHLCKAKRNPVFLEVIIQFNQLV